MSERYISTITPPGPLIKLNFSEIWHYRELLYTFVWRDIKVKYKQTILGISWALLQPMVTMVLFTIIFGGLINQSYLGIPYPLFLYSGLIFWNYFSTALSQTSNSLTANESIITKIYFPRIILPTASAISPVIDFLFSLIVLFGLLLFYKQPISVWGIFFLPLGILMSTVVSIGLGSLFAAINVRYRDVRYVLPFVIQTLMFVTPVFYPITIVPDKFWWLLALNPLYGIITLSRGAMFSSSPTNIQLTAISLVSAFFLFVIGFYYFRKTEQFFADII